MESCVGTVVKLAVEIQTLIKQNELLEQKTRGLLVFIGSLQTALLPLGGFSALPYSTQQLIYKSIIVILETMEALKMDLITILKVGFTLKAEKQITILQNKENILRDTLQSLQINWGLVETMNEQTKFNANRLITHTNAKRFWSTHFGSEQKYVSWIDFKHTIQEVYCVQNDVDLDILEKALCQEGQVSVYKFDRVTQGSGVPTSFWTLIATDNPARLKTMVKEELKSIEALHSKIIAIINDTATKAGNDTKNFLRAVPIRVTKEVCSEMPDFGVKRILMLGFVSSSLTQDIATNAAGDELEILWKALVLGIQECVQQIIYSIQFAVSQGFCTRLVTLEFVEETANKVISKLSQKDFVINCLADIKKELVTDLKKRIDAMPSLSYEQSIVRAVTPLASLNETAYDQQAKECVATNLMSCIVLEFVRPLQAKVTNTNKK